LQSMVNAKRRARQKAAWHREEVDTDHSSWDHSLIDSELGGPTFGCGSTRGSDDTSIHASLQGPAHPQGSEKCMMNGSSAGLFPQDIFGPFNSPVSTAAQHPSSAAKYCVARHTVDAVYTSIAAQDGPISTSHVVNRTRSLKINTSEVSTAVSVNDHHPETMILNLHSILSNEQPAKEWRLNGNDHFGIVASNKAYFSDLFRDIESSGFRRDLARCLSGGGRSIGSFCGNCDHAKEALWDKQEIDYNEACICDRLYCGRCYYQGSRCDCKRSMFTYEEVVEDEVATTFICEVGYETRFCAVCGKCNNFEDLEPCDARGCTLEPPQLCHIECLTRVSHGFYPDGAFMCPLCVASRREPYVDSDSDGTNGSDLSG